MEEILIESTRCVECGSDTGRMGGGFVNRIPSDGGDSRIDAYNCGRCQENIDWFIFGDSAYDKCESDEDEAKVDLERDTVPDWADIHCDEEAYDKYLEERIKEVDEQDPEAKVFRTLIEDMRKEE
jgi:hypothetical protein